MAIRILIIESNREIRENTAELLELSHHKVIKATNGVQGYNALKNYQPDLIICDIMLLESGGVNFLRKRQTDPVLSKIPVILLAADPLSPGLKNLPLKSTDFCLGKPFSEQELMDAILTVSQKPNEYGV